MTNSRIVRLIDANFNRAREALRVQEDCGRFVLNDSTLSVLAKQLRHELCRIISQNYPNVTLCAARDTVNDVGTTISTQAEMTRSDSEAILTAAAKRLSEALRCLEEYSKLEAPAAAAALEQLRYQSYTLEKRLMTQLAVGSRFKAVRLYVLVTSALCHGPVEDVCKVILQAGVDCIQFREKEMPDGERLDLAKRVGELCRDHQAVFIMNDRPDLAVLADADGVHLGQDDLQVAHARQILQPHQIVGKSTHNQAERDDALVQCPDYIACGAVFPSPTKPSVATLGLEQLRVLALGASCPVIAIGGITPDNVTDVLAAGAWGIALCSAVIGADDPGTAVQRFREKIDAFHCQNDTAGR